ncbi:hypothetical protein ACU6QD_11515 [Corynebacterium glucuronolyticum]
MVKKFFGVCVATVLTCGVVPAAQAVTLDPRMVPPRTQITVRQDSGLTFSTGNSHEARPALSLSKLYLGYWVLKYGDPSDKQRVENMIRYSEDGTASYLDQRYRNAISGVIAEFGLRETFYTGYWGSVRTSTEDVSRFTAQIRNDPIAAPIIRGMETVAPIAADGYHQNYGTSRVPGVQGTKFGWADRRDIHASVSFAPGFTVAANTYGGPDAHTADVVAAVHNDPHPAPAPPPAPVVTPLETIGLGSSEAVAAVNAQVSAAQEEANRVLEGATEQAQRAARDACVAANQSLAPSGLAPVC